MSLTAQRRRLHASLWSGVFNNPLMQLLSEALRHRTPGLTDLQNGRRRYVRLSFLVTRLSAATVSSLR